MDRRTHAPESATFQPASDKRAVTPGARTGQNRRTPAPGALGLAPSEVGRLDEAAHDVLHALAVRLAGEAETVAERFVVALREDGRFPGARGLSTVQLRDHATPLVGLIASQLMIVGETRGTSPELLADGAHVRRVMAELHGAQRHRLGWSEADIEREGPLLRAEVERTLRASLSTAVPGVPETSSESVRVAVEYAVAAVRQMVEQGTATAVRSHRFARATATP